MTKKLDLTLHCGASQVDLPTLRKAPTPVATATHVPIPHYHLYQQVLNNLDNVGLQLVQQQHALTRNGDRYFGMLQVANGSGAEDYSLVIGLRNSHDKRFPAGFCVGSGVFVCDNLAFSSEVVLARRHTLNIMDDLPNLVARGLGKLSDHRNLMDHRVEAYKLAMISNQEAESAIIQMLRVKAVTTTQVKDIVHEWDQPSHKEFNTGNVWKLFNAVTETMRGKTPLDDMPRRSFALHGVCDQLAQVEFPKEKIVNAA